MKTKDGEQTGIFGEWLTQYINGLSNYQDYNVYYDHGDQSINPNVTVIYGLVGDNITRKTQLAQVDVMVTNPNNELDLLIEIEESECSPKKILGDLFTLLMCNNYAIKITSGHQFFNNVRDSKLIIAGVVSTKGTKVQQIEEVILPRLDGFKSPEDSIDINNLTLVFKGNIDETISELKNHIFIMYN